MTDHTTASPSMGAPAMGSHPPPLQHGAPKGIAISDAFTYLPIAYRAIEHLGDITAFINKLKPYIAMAMNDLPDLVAEGKALINQIAPNLLTGLAVEPAKFDVSWVQRALNKVSNAGLKVDGQYGPLTHEAIRLYQVAKGLEPDTWAGPITVAKLFKEAGANP